MIDKKLRRLKIKVKIIKKFFFKKYPFATKIFLFLFGKGLFSLIVIIPFILTSLYYTTITTPRYEANTTIIFKDINQLLKDENNDSNNKSVSKNTSSADNYLLIKYIKSFNMYQELNKKFDIDKQFSNKNIDFISRLNKNATQKNKLKYYQKMVSATYNQDAQVIMITAQGYDPYQAYNIANGITDILQKKLDNMNYDLANKRLEYSKLKFIESKNNLQKIYAKIIKYQNNYKIINPKKSLNNLEKMIFKLNNKLIEEQILFDKNNLLQNNFNKKILKENKYKINIINQYINKLKNEAIENKKNISLNKQIIIFESLMNDFDITLETYKSSLFSYIKAKTEITDKQKQLIIVENASLPDISTLPKKFYNISSTLVTLLMIYSIINLISKIIKEHRNN